MNMKRLLALWLVAVLVLGGLTATGAEPEEKVNLFQNPGFEEMTTEKGTYDDFDASVGRPLAWGSFNGWTDDIKNNTARCCRTTTSNPHSGTNCTRILITWSGNSPSVSQTVENLTPGGIYEIGFFARSPRIASEFSLQITFYKNGETVRTQNMLRTLPTNAWKEYKLQFPFPDDADSMLVLFKLGGKGDIYLDDVFLYKISDKPEYTLETDAIFYYSDDPTPCVATVNAMSERNAAVTFVLKDDRNREVLRNENVAFSGKCAVWEYPLASIAKEKKGYTLEAHVTENGKTTLLTETVYRYKRPSRLRNDGVYLKDGQPFMPVIAHGINADQLAKCKEAGINVVTVSYWYADYEKDETRIKTILRTLKEHGLMGIIGLYRGMMPAGADYNLGNTTRLIMAIDADPELKNVVYAYSMMDEPLQNDAWCDAELEKGYKLIRDLDDDIPVLTVDCSNLASVTKRNMNYCDIYSCDAYYAGNGALSHWPGEMVKLASDVAKEGGRCVYHLTMAFYWRNQFPTGAEIRHMIYQAFLNDAKGVGYYTINDATPKFDANGKIEKDKDGNEIHLALYETDRWAPLCRFGAGDLLLARDHFVFGEGKLISEISGEGYMGRIWEKDGKTFVLLLSGSETETKTVTAEMPYTSFLLGKYGEKPDKCIETGGITYTLSPRECALFVCEETETGVLRLYREDNTETKSLKKGETIRAEIVTGRDVAISLSQIGLYADDGKELILLENFTKTESGLCNIWACTFAVPSDGLSYKAFFWNGLTPQYINF